MTEQTTTPPAPDPEPTPTTSGDDVYAVYDKTYLKYVGGTHATRKAATDEAKRRKVKSYEIRKV